MFSPIVNTHLLTNLVSIELLKQDGTVVCGGGDRGVVAREKRGKEVYRRWEKRRWKVAFPHSILQSIKSKEAAAKRAKE